MHVLNYLNLLCAHANPDETEDLVRCIRRLCIKQGEVLMTQIRRPYTGCAIKTATTKDELKIGATSEM